MAILLASASLAACQTAPAFQSGFLGGGYEGLITQEDTLRASIRQRRDEAAAQQVERVFIEPTVAQAGAGEGLSEAELAMVLSEVDRQICYEVSERFTVLDTREAAQARIRTAVTQVRPTGQFASAVSAAAAFFIPGPIDLRAPGTTGGLAVESEMVDTAGRQVAALAWARNANVVGMDKPSLSRVGDAMQMSEPLGDAVGDAFAPSDRVVRDIADPDPCLRFGPRVRPAGFLAGMATGLYVPQLSTQAPPPATTPE